jgi:hypothetical protein
MNGADEGRKVVFGRRLYNLTESSSQSLRGTVLFSDVVVRFDSSHFPASCRNDALNHGLRGD